MASARTKSAALIAFVRELLGVHARILIPLAVAVAVGFVALGLLLVLYAMGIGAVAYQQLVAFATTAEKASLVTVGLMVPIIAVAILASLTWAGLAVQLANAASGRRRISTGTAALVALRRAPRVFVLFVIVVAATVAAILLAPLLTVAGLIGLLLSVRFSRLPRRGVLIAMAVPFGVALLVLVRWSLAPASVWLANSGIRAAFTDSAARVRGRELQVGVTLAIAAGVTLMVTELVLGLARILDSGVYGEFVGQLVALVLVGPLLFAALAVHYRAGGEAPTAAPVVTARVARRSRVAVAVILSLLVPMLISANPAPAAAVATISTTTRVFGPYDRSASYGTDQTYDGTVFASATTPTGTVELLADGVYVAEATLVAGAFSITTDLIPMGASLQEMTVRYLGDADHLPSVSPASAIESIFLELTKANAAPVLTASTLSSSLGSTVTLTATVPNLGAGPTGSVTFQTPSGPLAPVALVGNVATVDVVITSTSTLFRADYSGDASFKALSSNDVTVSATKAVATVNLTGAGSGTLEYGTVVTLDAEVAIPGSTPDQDVTFTSSSSGTLGGSTVPIVAGHATLTVCAGDSLGCPSGSLLLGAGAQTLTASYPETATNLPATSNAVNYVMVSAATTTVVTINPTTVQPFAGIFLYATVDGVTSTATPRGLVNFYAEMPVSGGGFAQSFIGSAPLVGGVATLFAAAGTGIQDIRWPAAAVSGSYFAAGDPFVSSSGSTPIVVDRYNVTATAFAFAPVPFVPNNVQVTLSHEPGSSADYAGKVTVTADTGATCFFYVASGSSVGSCPITWTTAGAHSVTADYEGDLVYESANSPTLPLGAVKGTPNLAPSITTNPVIALTNTTVVWSLFDGGATGTVTVIGDGVTWCTAVPLTDQSCTGQFPLSSATGSVVDVRVQYSGDANWDSREQTAGAIVKRCVPLSITSANSSMGTVTIDTPSNCPGGEYLSGTLVTVSAHPIAPNVFVDWQKLGGLSFVHDSYLPTISFVAGADFMTWAHLATFSAACYPVTAAVTGHGGMSVYPATNCALAGGGGGYLPGTAIVIYPDTLYNPNYDEKDAFYSFGAVTGGTVKKDSSARPYLSVAVNSPLTIPVKFGPQCRPVTVVFDPKTTGDAVTVPTAENCQSPLGNGFLRYTDVDVTAVSGDPTLAIVGWKLDGVAKPDWGTSNDQSFLAESASPVLTVQLVHCYTLDLKVDGAQDARSREVGTVDVDVEPNCPDGSRRYLGGTEITVTPEVLVDGGAFNGWDLVRIPGVKPADGTGKLTALAKIVTMTADATVKAGFVFKDTCSSIQVIDNIFDDTRVVTLDDDGCGEGQYFDLQKQTALRDGALQESFWHDSDRSDVFAHINPDIPLDVYLSVRGDTGTCFDGVRPTGPTEDPDAWKTYGPLTGDVDCAVGGPIQIQVATCQTVKSTVSFIAESDPSGRVWPRSWFPGTFYLPNADGSIGAFDQGSFNWMVTSNVYVDNGVVKLADLGDDPCTRGGSDTYAAGRNLAVYGLGLTSGFEVAGWDNLDPDGRVEGNPVLIETDTTGPVFPVNPVFSVSCGTLVLGEGMSVLDGARCPGSSAADNSFVMGTAIQVRAAQHVGDRVLYGFKSGVVGGQIVEEPVTKRLIGFVLMDVDGKVVTGDYPTDREAIGRAIVQGLKISAGILAIVAPIALGLLFPPAGIFFAFLGAAAGIVNLIPHGAEVAGVLDLINPTKITTCAARWAFGNTGNPTGGLNPGSIGSLAWTGFKVYQGKDVITQNIGKFGIGGSVLGTAAGLYEAGIHHAELGPQSMDQLAATSTMTGCLDQQWRIAGSNLTGN